MQLNSFEKTDDFGKVLSIGAKSTGPNSAVWFDARPGRTNAFEGPKYMKQSFTVRPASLSTSINSKTKFEINLQVSDESHIDFMEAAKRFDEWVVKSVFERKDELLPARSKFIKSEDALMPIYASGRVIKTGSTSADGTKYPDLIKLKIEGKWNEYVKELVTKSAMMRGSMKTVPDYCIWKPRTEPLEAGETKFYLWTRVNDKGEDVYVDKVNDTETGEVRMVGPQDCLPGSEITPVFSASCLYFNEGFGVSLMAKALFIKHRANIVSSSKVDELIMPSFATVDTSAVAAAHPATAGKRGRGAGDDGASEADSVFFPTSQRQKTE